MPGSEKGDAPKPSGLFGRFFNKVRFLSVCAPLCMAFDGLEGTLINKMIACRI